MLSHLAWLEAYADAKPGDIHPWWDADMASLLTLTYFDEWIGAKPRAGGGRQYARAIRGAIAKIGPEHAPLRDMLGRLMDTMPGRFPGVFAVSDDLLKVADYFADAGRYPLALDILSTVHLAAKRSHVSPRRVADLRAECHFRAGRSLEALGELKRARRTFNAAAIAAHRGGNEGLRILCDIALAGLVQSQGDLNNAEAALTLAVGQAEELGHALPISQAYRGRAGVRFMRGKYDDALKDYIAAIPHLGNVGGREAVWSDIAACAGAAGYHAAARRVFEHIATHGSSEQIRGTAIVNLLFASRELVDEVAFRRWRAVFESTAINARSRYFGLVFVADGIRRFDGADAAAPLYAAAERAATAAGVHQAAYMAAQRLIDLKKEEAPTQAPQVLPAPTFLERALQTIGTAAI
jgi:tetratricopeptide (TPR) repeat protein